MGGMPLCQSCKEKMESKFQEVKEYIRTHAGTTIPEVAEACEVDQNQIRAWLREDRLELTQDSPIRLSCEGCGAQIRSGRFCDKCKINTMNDINGVIRSDRDEKLRQLQERQRQVRDGDRMRFL
jgi:hypothetical protein